MHPTVEDVWNYKGRPSPHGGDTHLLDAYAKAEAHLKVVTQTVRAYVRDRGFDATGEPAEDLAAVIVSATARSIENPTALQSDADAIDDASASKRYGVFNGWTLAELAILHRYRKRAL